MDATNKQAAKTAVLPLMKILEALERYPAGSKFTDPRGVVFFEILKPGTVRFTIDGVSETWTREN